MMRPIPKKRQAFEFIRGYIASNSEAPTLKEIGERLDLRSSGSVHAILVALESDGLITRTPNVNRGIEIALRSNGPAVGWMDR